MKLQQEAEVVEEKKQDDIFKNIDPHHLKLIALYGQSVVEKRTVYTYDCRSSKLFCEGFRKKKNRYIPCKVKLNTCNLSSKTITENDVDCYIIHIIRECVILANDIDCGILSKYYSTQYAKAKEIKDIGQYYICHSHSHRVPITIVELILKMFKGAVEKQATILGEEQKEQKEQQEQQEQEEKQEQ